MSFNEAFEREGNWLFRHRGLLPLLLAPLVVVALAHSRYLGNSHRLDLKWELVCLGVGLLGVAIRVATVAYVPAGTSGRNTHDQRASSLNTTGMYSVLRHPLYIGNFLMWLAFAMFARSAMVVALVTAVYLLYYERIAFAEEAFLREKFGPEYDAWAAATPAIVPRLRNWRSASGTFSLRTVIKREYSGLLGLVGGLWLLDMLQDIFVTGQLLFDPFWTVAFAAVLVVSLVIRVLIRHTKVLHVEGR